MKYIVSILSIALLALLLCGCATEAANSWQLRGKAITGGGAVAGRDYVVGLKPNAGARKYFTKLDKSKQPVETVRRGAKTKSKSGVKFVKNGGILIPPGVTISFTNRGYCMDPNLPAPKAGDEFQLIPMTQLIPKELQNTYLRIAAKGTSGDAKTQANMQHLVWALRTAGTNAAYANNLTTEQRRLLDSFSDRPGLFDAFHAQAKSRGSMMKELAGLADSYLNITIGGVTYKASDLLDPEVGLQKINDHLNQLIAIGQKLPVVHTGFNYGEIYPGIYTDVRGTAPLEYKARIANTTDKPFVFYPMYYVGQVGSPSKNSALAFHAAPDTTQRQRVTTEIANNVDATCPNDIQELTLDFTNLKGPYKSLEEAKKDFEKDIPEDAATNACKEYFSVVVKENGIYKITPIKGVTLSSTTDSRTGQKINGFKISERNYGDILFQDNADIVAFFHTHPLGDQKYSDADKNTIAGLNRLRDYVKKTGNAQIFIYDPQNKTWVPPITK